MKIDRYEEIPIVSLTTSRSKARAHSPTREIAKLAQSIKKLGLLTPIIVAPASIAGKYEIVIGQRQALAVQTLGWAKIFAAILDQRLSDTQVRVILLTESEQHQPLRPKDYISISLLSRAS
jgi:ParB/RepB/Spo0J family partition protein